MAGIDKATDDARTDGGTEPIVNRRKLLRLGGYAAAGAGVAALATAVSAAPAGATTGAMQFGTTNDAGTDVTDLTSSNGNDTLTVENTGTGDAVFGTSTGSGSGLRGVSDSGFGVKAESSSGTALVAANNGSADVVNAVSFASGTGVRAQAFTGTGVDTTSFSGVALNAHLDQANSTADVVDVVQAGLGQGMHVTLSNVANAATAMTVTQGGTGRGIDLTTTSGNGIEVTTAMGAPIVAVITSATNLLPAIAVLNNGKGSALTAAGGTGATHPTVDAGSSSAQPAVSALGKTVPASGAVALAGNGSALSVKGVASFTRSNVVAVATSATSVLVSVPGGLTATSHVLATVQTNSGTVAVRAAVPNPANGKVTIYLTGAAPAGTKVAWFVFG